MTTAELPVVKVDADVAGGLTARVLGSFQPTPSPRLRELLLSLVGHLHAFAMDVQLTEAEWETGIEFVTRLGQISDDKRQETILLSDVLGLSMLVVGINHPPDEVVTGSTVFGPFYVANSPAIELGGDLAGGAVGRPCFYSGLVLSPTGDPVSGARLEIWHSDEAGNYDVQYPGISVPQGRGHLFSDGDGSYRFTSVLPEPYSLPVDGPVGDLMTAAERSPMRPAHVHFMITAPGFQTLTTHVFRAGDPYLGDDAVFGEKDSLVTEFVRHEAGAGPDGSIMPEPFFAMTYDFVLKASPEQT